MQKTSKYTLGGRTQLTCLTTRQFKTAVVSAGYALPLECENAATAVLPYLLRRGTAEYPDLNAMGAYLDELYGAQVEPFVRKIGDRLVVGFVAEALDESVLPVGARVIELVIALLGKLFHAPALESGRFRADVLESEKRNLADRIRGLKNDTRTYAARRARELMHAGERLGFCELGTAEGAESLTEEQVHAAYDRLLAEGELELFYCGTLEGEQLVSILRRGMPETAGNVVYAPDRAAYDAGLQPRTIIEEMNVTQGKMTICLRSPYDGASPEYPALLLFTEILGGYTGSRLFCNVRERMSLCYYASAGLALSTGEVTIASGIENGKFEVARDAVLAQLNDLCAGNLTQEELDRARRTRINALRSMQDTARSMESFWQTRMMCGVPDDADALIAKLEALTREQVLEAGRTLRVDLIYFLKGVGA